ncbi:hypothetical protein [Novisyntrophococcus fermenticellae]|uniref:hypothetical protein n=1 Tax=Novisyntrophococcus fermenticellae TaxID=2068655 RepID=UPI001E2886CC|nr:hypothetical protein [Novisyntrophococcus fermenticellae]
MNKLMKLIFKRRKKSWYLLISVMILAYFLIAVLRIAFACFDRTEEADREKQYGNWHVAVIDADTDTVNGLKNHATVEKFGISYTYGMVLDKENKDLGKIGTADLKTRDMENISILEGRFPEKEGEIAIERLSLKARDITAGLGDAIYLPIRVTSEKGSEIVNYKYKLVGIVQDYSTKLKGTTPDKRDYVSFFINHEDDVAGYEGTGNFIYRLKKKYLNTNKEILQVKGNSAIVLTNNYTYYELGKESGHQLTIKLLQRGLVFGGSLLSFMLVSCILFMNYMNEQRDTWKIFHKLGKHMRAINVLLFKEIVIANVIALCVGTLIGIIVTGIVYSGVTYLGNDTIQVEIPAGGLLLSEMAVLLGLLASDALGIFIQAKGISRNKKELRRKRRKVKKSYVDRMLGQTEWNWKYSFLILFVLFFSILQVDEKKALLSAVEQQNPDFRWSILYSYYPLSDSVSDNIYEQVKKVYGIDKVEAFKSNNYLYASWEGIERSKYVKELQEHYWQQFAGVSEPQVFVVGIEPDSEAYHYYTKGIKNNYFNKEKFDKGEMVLVYVPDFDLKSGEYFYTNEKGRYHENTLKAGDKLRIEGEEINEVEVGGILYNFNKREDRRNIPRPLSVIGSYGLCESLDSKTKESFGYLDAFVSKHINYSQTMEEMKQLGNKPFNDLEIKSRYNSDYIKEISIWILADILCIAMISIIYCSKKITQGFKRKEVGILSSLGMNSQRYYLCRCKVSLCSSLLGGIIGGIAAFFIKVIFYNTKHQFEHSINLNDRVKLGILYVWNWMPLKSWGYIFLLFLVVTCLFTMAFGKKSIET